MNLHGSLACCCVIGNNVGTFAVGGWLQNGVRFAVVLPRELHTFAPERALVEHGVEALGEIRRGRCVGSKSN